MSLLLAIIPRQAHDCLVQAGSLAHCSVPVERRLHIHGGIEVKKVTALVAKQRLSAYRGGDTSGWPLEGQISAAVRLNCYKADAEYYES